MPSYIHLKLVKHFFDFPSPSPVPNLTLKPFLLSFILDVLLESTINPTEDGVLGAKAEYRAEIIGTVTDVNDTVKIIAMALEEGC
jgi:hypothetical protein